MWYTTIIPSFNGLRRRILTVLCGLAALTAASVLPVAAQDAPQAPVAHPSRHWVVYGGIGPNVYFNNLVIGKDYVRPVNYSTAFRFIWEPEHALSIGLESGYYRLYAVDFGDQSDVRITNNAIPIQLALYMKMLRHFYLGFSSGQSILLNRVANAGDDLDASSLSLGDFSGTFGYRHALTARLSLNAEAKFYYASKLNDKNLALLFLIGYQL